MTEDIVDVNWLIAHKASVKVVDVAYAVKPKPNAQEFKEKYYGKFEKLMAEMPNADYAAEHVPGAVHYNLDIGSYPTDHVKFEFYSAEEFSEYVRLLGINKNDHIVFVGRGPAAGMVFAARAWFLFKVYGHNRVSVLNGGLDAWKGAGQKVESGVQTVSKGDWQGTGPDKTKYVTFEELSKKEEDGECKLDKCQKFNYLDARAKEQFSGAQPLGFPAPQATGAHVKGAKNLPLSQLVGPGGVKSKDEVSKALTECGYDPSSETVTTCNGGVQASLMTLVLSRQGIKAKLYNGSMLELATRASHYINEK